ncbi:hypothetical protein [Bacillus solitudinis]|nr:hypothetical protein [Bacillus solitudinis]
MTNTFAATFIQQYQDLIDSTDGQALCKAYAEFELVDTKDEYHEQVLA